MLLGKPEEFITLSHSISDSVFTCQRCRGMPKGKVNKRIDALAFMVGYKFDNLSVGYSYDFTISRLGIGSGESHEISLAITFKTVARKRWKALPCPTF
ncbi:MAG TPA: type IX secretion system membrane protein PorP/SprF [Bacteroidales bacterium]|nr:type IX secretion system membrane protein PorP/SprF [Bacteroidales bacterium]